MAQFVREIVISNNQKIVVSRTEYKGKEGLDIRTHYWNSEAEEWRPSRQGCRFYSEPTLDDPNLTAEQAIVVAVQDYADEFGV